MKIALYLGSFNPFHNGHRDVVISAIKDFGMDRVIIVPSMQNPWKKEKVLDFDKRVEIICEAIDAIWFKDPKNNKKELSHLFNYVSIENIEKSLIPPYYSYATLHALKNKYCNDEIFVLCGEDTMEKIPDWMNGGEIIKDYNFLIVDRPKNSISSTYIREMLRTRHKMDAYYSDERLGNYVCRNVIELLKKYY
jgi:nicotinate-nucleotide adenylyltransferase